MLYTRDRILVYIRLCRIQAPTYLQRRQSVADAVCVFNGGLITETTIDNVHFWRGLNCPSKSLPNLVYEYGIYLLGFDQK